MPSKSQPVRVGPFTGGLNTYSDPSTIEDAECSDINNFDIDLDGTLISRPPVTMINGVSNLGFRILGYFTWTDGVIYAIASTTAGTYAYNTNTFAWTTITVTFSATSMVQYANKVWIVSPPLDIDPSGSWDPTAGFVAVASMAHGNTCCMYKERMFVGSGAGSTTPARIQFSLAGNLAGAWVGTDFLDVNNGDGQNIIEITNYNGAIVVFKRDSTYMYAYDSSPTKGAVQLLSSTIGVVAKDCVSVFENNLYVMYAGDVYVISNWNWEQLNTKVAFAYVNTHVGATQTDYALSVVGNRLICKYFDNYYVYGFTSKAWTKWSFTADAQLFPGKFLRYPVTDSTTGIDKYYAGSALIAVVQLKSLMLFKDAYTLIDIETMNVSVKSKVYDFNTPFSYKKLSWWGSDLLANSLIGASIGFNAITRPTWAGLSTYTWTQWSAFSWDAPTSIPLDVSDSANVRSFTGNRMFVKWLKAIRFRQLAFNINSIVDGTTTTGPFKLFSITAFVSNKEQSNNKVN